MVRITMKKYDCKVRKSNSKSKNCSVVSFAIGNDQ